MIEVEHDLWDLDLDDRFLIVDYPRIAALSWWRRWWRRWRPRRGAFA